MAKIFELLTVATSTTFSLPALAAGDEVGPVGPVMLCLFLTWLLSYVGYAMGVSLQLSHAMIAICVLNMCFLAFVSSVEGFQKIVERIEVVFTVLAFFNLSMAIGLSVGRGKFGSFFTAFKKKVLQND